jgi:hypothetical protein
MSIKRPQILLVRNFALCFTGKPMSDIIHHRQAGDIAAATGSFARFCGAPTNLQAELLRLCARIGYSPPRL